MFRPVDFFSSVGICVVIYADSCTYGNRVVFFAARNDGATRTRIRECVTTFQNVHTVPNLWHVIIESSS